MSEKKQDTETVKREVYRKVFLSPEGRAVLTDILNDLGHLQMDISTPEEIALSNYAKQLLAKLGIWQPHNEKRIVDAYLNMQYMGESK